MCEIAHQLVLLVRSSLFSVLKIPRTVFLEIPLQRFNSIWEISSKALSCLVFVNTLLRLHLEL